MQLRILYLKQEDVIKAGVLDFDAALKDIEEVFRMMAKGEVVMPPKVAMDLYFPDGSPKGHLVAMPAYIKSLGIAGIKWAAGFFKNPELYGLPHGMDIIVLSDPESGRPLAIMDGTLITAVRTGAVAGVGAKFLAPDGASVAALIGAGVVGRAAGLALCSAMRGLSEVKIYDLKEEKARRLVNELPVDARSVRSAEEAIRDSDIIITATTSHSQFVKLEWLKKDCLCIELGKNEFEDSVILNSGVLVVDYWEQIKARSWVSLTRLWRDGLLNESRIKSIIDVVKEGRVEGGGLRFFSPIGMACEDLIVAYRIYRTAREKGLGIELSLWEEPYWA